MNDDIPADVNEVIDSLTRDVARLTREKAILTAQISTLSKRLKEAENGGEESHRQPAAV
ncbi:hypothetical protein [Bifidobacterium cuniculi]|uniref:hypothetical protein n=1 Tax=Bifidobacterium cuniculi TaxID=1688 RepID=UPI001363CC05|nr:hypothetical protein [Bifidobacterium cuniculi]